MPREGNSASARDAESRRRSARSHSTPWPDKAGVRLWMACDVRGLPRGRLAGTPDRNVSAAAPASRSPPRPSRRRPGTASRQGSRPPRTSAMHRLPCRDLRGHGLEPLEPLLLGARQHSSAPSIDQVAELLPGEERLPHCAIPLLERHQVRQVDDVVAHDPRQVPVGPRDVAPLGLPVRPDDHQPPVFEDVLAQDAPGRHHRPEARRAPARPRRPGPPRKMGGWSSMTPRATSPKSEGVHLSPSGV